MDKQLWCELVQRYAIRARVYSDGVAALGQKAHLGPEQSRHPSSPDILDDIQTRLELCIAVDGEIDRYVKQKLF